MNPRYYEDIFNKPRPGDHPDWSHDVTTAIDGIFKLLLQVAESIEALEARIAALEAANPAPQEETTP